MFGLTQIKWLAIAVGDDTRAVLVFLEGPRHSAVTRLKERTSVRAAVMPHFRRRLKGGPPGQGETKLSSLSRSGIKQIVQTLPR